MLGYIYESCFINYELHINYVKQFNTHNRVFLITNY